MSIRSSISLLLPVRRLILWNSANVQNSVFGGGLKRFISKSTTTNTEINTSPTPAATLASTTTATESSTESSTVSSTATSTQAKASTAEQASSTGATALTAATTEAAVAVHNAVSSQLQAAAPCPDRLLQRLLLECQCNESAVLKSYAQFITMTCKHLDLDLKPIVWPRRQYERIVQLKSVHIHKKHRVQYEMRTFIMQVTILHLTGSTTDTFLEYVQRMCPESVAMKVTEYQLCKFPPTVEAILAKTRAAAPQ